MQLTIELPDHLANQLQAIPNLNEFLAKVLTQSLTEQPIKQTIQEQEEFKTLRILSSKGLLRLGNGKTLTAPTIEINTRHASLSDAIIEERNEAWMR